MVRRLPVPCVRNRRRPRGESGCGPGGPWVTVPHVRDLGRRPPRRRRHRRARRPARADAARGRVRPPQLGAAGRRAGPGVRCIAPDRRGFGLTTYEPEPHADLVDTVAVLDDLGVAAAAVVGASMGGRLAVDLALAHPDRVAALVLIGPGVRGAPVLVPDSPAVEALDRAIQAAEEAGDLDAVNELEARVWLDGPHAPAGRVTGPPATCSST